MQSFLLFYSFATSGSRVASLPAKHIGQWRVNSVLLCDFDFLVFAFYVSCLICSRFTTMDCLASLAPQRSPRSIMYTVAKP